MAERPESEAPVPIARLGRPHGIAGEISAMPLWDGDPSPLVGLDGEVDGDPTPRRIESIRGSGRWILALSGVSSPDDVRPLVNRLLRVSRADLPGSIPAAPYHFELVGMSVVDRSGRELGTVRSIEEAPGGDLLALDDDARVLIPFRPMVVEIDRERRRLVVELPEGLLEVNRREPK